MKYNHMEEGLDLVSMVPVKKTQMQYYCICCKCGLWSMLALRLISPSFVTHCLMQDNFSHIIIYKTCIIKVLLFGGTT